MKNFLARMRDLNTVVKIIIFVVLMLTAPIFAVLFLALLLVPREANPDKYKNEIEAFKRYYDILRPYVQNSEYAIINIGSYACEYEGKLFLGSRFISIYATNISSAVVNEVPSIEQRKIEDKMYYQFPIKRKYSKAAKNTIILEVAKYVYEKYPDDKVNINKSIPIGMFVVGFNKIASFFDV